MKSQKEDISFGQEGEKNVQGQLEELVGNKLSHSGKFAVLDFTTTDNTIYVELKTRRHYHNQYPTTIVGLNKIKFCKDPTKKYYFAFAFNDGLYYIQYERDLFDTFAIDTDYWCGFRSGCFNKAQVVIHIPVSLLKKFETKPTSSS